MYYTYAMYSKTENKFYIGYTDNIDRRIDEHITLKTLSSKRIKNLIPVYYEACMSKKDARCRELQLKTGFGRGYLRKRLEDYLNSLRV